MKHSLFLSLFFILSNLVSITPTLNAQKQAPIESKSQIYFQSLNFEQQRLLVREWMNRSFSTPLPSAFAENARAFYPQDKQGEKQYLKYTEAFKPLFNENIHAVDRINYCTFLLENFSEEEIPLQLIQERKKTLIDSSTK